MSSEVDHSGASLPNCARCPYLRAERRCRDPQGKAPPGCPTVEASQLLAACEKEYQEPQLREFARQASIQEAEGYGQRDRGYDHVVPIKPRLLEIAEFADRMGYHWLGLAYCGGLQREASIVARFYQRRGFEVISVACKAGGLTKETLGLDDSEKIVPGSHETMCNPVMQAMVLNEHCCELDILLGLCVGHDAIFLQRAQAPCTVLAVKDRVLGHNPLAAVYQLDSYYRSLKP